MSDDHYLLWKYIIELHWDYVHSEENLLKLEKRKILDEHLKKLLRTAPPKRKFFLPETKLVLKNSILQLDDFTAYRAIVGFDSICQYANNLLTNPWRKEYKTIKLYSGFYQHEIDSNLVDAEILFEAMGYKRVSNQTLVLEGAICEDQVANVSRDAIAACVECLMMSDIWSGLINKQLSSSWSDIFTFRETYSGDEKQAITSMAYFIYQEHHGQKENVVQDSAYNVQCTNYSNLQRQSNYQQQPIYGQQQIHNNGFNNCLVHHQYPPLQQQQQHQPHQPHQHGYINGATSCNNGGQQPQQSISQYGQYQLHPQPDHYSDPNYRPYEQLYDNNHLHGSRHNNYDSVDHHHSCSQQSNLYNVSGNRYPLPPSLSNQFTAAGSNYSVIQLNGQCNGGGNSSSYTPNYYPNQANICHSAATVEQQYYMGNPYYRTNGSGGTTVVPVDHLIDLADAEPPPPPLPQSILSNKSAYAQHNHHDDYYYQKDLRMPPAPPEPYAKTKQKMYDPTMPRNNFSTQIHHDLHGISMGGGPQKQHSKFADYDDMNPTNGSKDSRASDFDSLDDVDFNSEKGAAIRNNDGVGSYDQWNFVYKKLGKPCYNKDNNDVGGETAVLVQGLDNNDKKSNRKSIDGPLASMASSKQIKKLVESNLVIKNDRPSKQQQLINEYILSQQQKQPNKSNGKLVSHHQQQKPQLVQKQSSQDTHKNNNNLIDDFSNKCSMSEDRRSTPSGAAAPPATLKKQSSSIAVGKKQPTSTVPHNSTAISTTSTSSEWNCKFCTYLNVGTVRICDICSKSKDFDINVTTTSKATTTCV